MKSMHRRTPFDQNMHAGGGLLLRGALTHEGMRALMRRMVVLVGVVVALMSSPVSAHADSYTTPGGVTVEGVSGDWTYYEDDHTLMITWQKGSKVTLSGETTTDTVILRPEGIKVVDLVIKDLRINAKDCKTPAMWWQAANGGFCDAMVRLTLEGDNYLESPKNYAAFQKDAYRGPGYPISKLHEWDPTGNNAGLVPSPDSMANRPAGVPWLQIVGNGSLEAVGGDGGAGIGGGSRIYDSSVNGQTALIAIGGETRKDKPTVKATGGYGAAGIGGGYANDYSAADTKEEVTGPRAQGVNIHIYNGTVEAQAGGDAAAIGGGIGGRGENIWIDGGTVKATNSGNPSHAGAAIGGGCEGAAHNIFVTGGTVHAIAKDAGGDGGGGVGGSFPARPFGNGSWATVHFLQNPLIIKVTGGYIDLSGSWDPRFAAEGAGRDGVHLEKGSQAVTPRFEISGGCFGGDYSQQGRTGIGKVYGMTPVSNHIVLHNLDNATSKRFPWKVEEGMNEFAVEGTLFEQSYSDGVLYIQSGMATISHRKGVEEAVYDRIELGGMGPEVTLKGLKITRPQNATGIAAAPIAVRSTFESLITLSGKNVLTAAGGAAGLQVNSPDGSQPSLTIKGTGSLDARGAGGGAGIGGANGSKSGMIIIKSGNIAASSDGGSAIGAGAGEQTAAGCVKLQGGSYADKHAVLGASGTGKVYGHTPDNPFSGLTQSLRVVVGNDDPAYPARIIPAEKAGSSLIVCGDYISNGADWVFENNELHIKSKEAMTIAMAPNAKTSGIRIVVDSGIAGGANLSLLGLNLDMGHPEGGAARGGSAIVLHSPAKVTLASDSVIKPGAAGASIANRGLALTLGGDGSLEAYGRGGASAIGGDTAHPSGDNITITSGVIRAQADDAFAAAIGSGAKGGAIAPASAIVIQGGYITAKNTAGGDVVLGGATGPGSAGAPVSLAGGYYADASAAPGGSEVGTIYGVSPSKGWRAIKTRDEVLAERYPYQVVEDTRDLKVSAPKGGTLPQEYVDYTYLDGTLEVLTSTPMVIEMADANGAATRQLVRVRLSTDDDRSNITLKDVKFEAGDWLDPVPFELETGGCALTLAGETTFTLHGGQAINSHTQPLVIKGDGTLAIHQNDEIENVALIGGKLSNEAADITITGGVFDVETQMVFDFGIVFGGGAGSRVAVTGGDFDLKIKSTGSVCAFGSWTSTGTVSSDGVDITGGAFGKGSVNDSKVYDSPVSAGYRVVKDDAGGIVRYRVEPAPCDLVIESTGGDELVFGEDWAYDIVRNVVTIKTEKPVRVSMADELAYPSTDKVTSGYTTTLLVSDPGAGKTASVELDGVKIEGDAKGAPAFEVTSGDLSLTLSPNSDNRLRGGNEKAALQVVGGKLSIMSEPENPGSLDAWGGAYAAGIGAGYAGGSVDISINGGTIVAKSAARGAAIGGGYKAKESISVTIAGGSFDLKSGGGTSHIGAGDGSTATVATSLCGGTFADANAVLATSLEERGSAYGIIPDEGHGVFSTGEKNHPVTVVPMRADALAATGVTEAKYDGKAVETADLVTIADGVDCGAVSATWMGVDGQELDTAPKNAGMYRLKVKLDPHVSEGVGYLGSEVVADVTIAQRIVEPAWSGLQQVVGDSVTVDAVISNVVPGDDVRVVLEGADKRVAGTHTARITGLVGNDAANYALPAPDQLERSYTIVPSGSDVQANPNHADGSYAYGDAITVRGRVNVKGEPAAEKLGDADASLDGAAVDAAPLTNEGDAGAGGASGDESVLEGATVRLLFGDRELARANPGVSGDFALEVSTYDVNLPVGVPVQLDVVFDGNGNVLPGVAQIEVTLAPRAIDVLMFAPPAGGVYTGEPYEPTLELIDAHLSADDVSVAYEDNINAGTAKAVVTGLGNYRGEVELSFEIEKAELDYEVVSQEVLEGDGIDVVKAPTMATGVNGETFAGVIAWEVADGFRFAAQEDGTVVLTWTFTLDEAADNYVSSTLTGQTEFTVKAKPVDPDGGDQGGGDQGGGDQGGGKDQNQGDGGQGSDQAQNQGGQGGSGSGAAGGAGPSQGASGSSSSALPRTGDTTLIGPITMCAAAATLLGIGLLAMRRRRSA